MADLSTLMQYAPTTAAGFMGINQANQEKESGLNQLTLQQAMQLKALQEQRTQEEQPLTMEKLRLANDSTRAKIPGEAADSDLKATNAAKARGTLQSDIDVGNVKNFTAAHEAIGNHLKSIAGDLDGLPDIEKHQAFARSLDNMGVPQGLKQAFVERYAQTPPSQLAKKLEEDSDRILREHPAYAQAYDTSALTNDAHILTEGMRNRTHLQGIQMQNENQQELERQRIAAGKYDHQKAVQNADALWAQSVQKAPNAAAAHAKAIAAAQFFRDHNEPEEAAKYANMEVELRPAALAYLKANPAGGGINTPAVTGLPANPTPDIAPPSAAPAGAAPANSGNAQNPQAAIEAAVRKQGGVYDPTKFEYRVNPQTGKVQSRPKQ